MKFICESSNMDDYLMELAEVNYSHPVLQETAEGLFNAAQTELEKAEADAQSESLEVQKVIEQGSRCPK
jgi:SMC interacting uncharacterized protein involved in chromosome segregation